MNNQTEIVSTEMVENLKEECTCAESGDNFHFLDFDVPIGFSEDDAFSVNANEFQRGVNDASYWAGYYATLIASGAPMEMAFAMVSELAGSKIAASNNLEIARINASTAEASNKKQIIEEKKSMI